MGRAANPAQFFGEAVFDVNGEEFTITINNRALLDAEGSLRESMEIWAPQLKAELGPGRKLQLRLVVALIFGGLRRNHPEIDEDWVIAVAHGEMGEDAKEAMAGAVAEAVSGIEVPEDELGNSSAPTPQPNRVERRARKAKKKASGSGTRSSGSGAKRATTRKGSG